ncbi:MAG: hypothetical protein JXA33_03660 [Anaerolineae bacterium]|nr:hypothetical protein [Anaerolineae bacterium]
MRNIEKLAKIIDHPVTLHRISALERDVISWQDDHLIEIEEHEVAVSGEKMAWLERHYPSSASHIEIDFKIKALSGQNIIIDWDVFCYNPAFGCFVHLLRWFEDILVFIYREKHDIYACNFTDKGLVKKVCVSHEISILQDELIYRHWSEPAQVHILSLPNLSLLKTLPYEEVLSEGIKPDELGSQNWYNNN